MLSLLHAYIIWWCSNWILWIRSDQEIKTDHKLSEAPNSLQLLSLWCIGALWALICYYAEKKLSWPGCFSPFERYLFSSCLSRTKTLCPHVWSNKDLVLGEEDFATSNNRCRYDDISVFLILQITNEEHSHTKKTIQ